MYEYKVLRREFVESDVLESEINGLAKQGWRLISTSISTDVRSGGDKTNVRRISTSSELYLLTIVFTRIFEHHNDIHHFQIC